MYSSGLLQLFQQTTAGSDAIAAAVSLFATPEYVQAEVQEVIAVTAVCLYVNTHVLRGCL